MDEGRLETHGPKHHSYRLKPAILILIGLVVGGAGLWIAVTEKMPNGSSSLSKDDNAGLANGAIEQEMQTDCKTGCRTR